MIKKILIFILLLIGYFNVNAIEITYTNPTVSQIYDLVTYYKQNYNATYNGSQGFSSTSGTSQIYRFCELQGYSFVSAGNPVNKYSGNGTWFFTSNPWLTATINDSQVYGTIICEDGTEPPAPPATPTSILNNIFTGSITGVTTIFNGGLGNFTIFIISLLILILVYLKIKKYV